MSNTRTNTITRPALHSSSLSRLTEQKQKQSCNQKQSHGFRQKVVSANKTAICTTTSKQVGRRTIRDLLLPPTPSSTNYNHDNINDSNHHDGNIINKSNGNEAYIVPIFQRRYCWTSTQWDTLWHDILKRNSIRHSLGRLTCTNVNGCNSINNRPHRSVIIDGQQRFTTITLVLAAIRDVLVALGSDGNADNVKANDLMESIHRMIFLDPPAMHEWVAQANDGNESNVAIEEGQRLEFCRLVPTFCDRNAYLAAILPQRARPVEVFLSTKYNAKWHRPLLAKRHFTEKIRELLRRPSTSEENTASATRTKTQILENLVRSLLDGMDMLYFPIDVHQGFDDGTEDAQVVYERLAIRDATWCRPKRTTEYRSMDGTDMIRNLLLGTFGCANVHADGDAEENENKKVEFYKRCWLPLERMHQTTGCEGGGDVDDDRNHEEESIKAFFRAFLDDEHKNTTVGNPSPLMSNEAIGGRIYRDFEAWMEEDFERWKQRANATKATTTMVMTKTSQRDRNTALSLQPLLSQEEAHAWAVARRLLEFANRRTKQAY